MLYILYMNRKFILFILCAITVLFVLPGLLDSLVLFVFVGKIPFSNVYLPVEAVFMIYAMLICLGIFATTRIGQDIQYHTSLPTEAVSSKTKTSKTSTDHKIKPNRQKANPARSKSKTNQTKIRRRQSAVKA